ncbi:CoA-transferase [Amycolatopsis sp. Poz14]|uniref:CoA-transferase n=1 Tax=Amycolatopsis sp. Poz14 TaxID=1447705 RepID=UPI001EE94C66|nr:CoA-transferase [Amycolatopsis sp. Poz14]MCG3753960.1 CoA synthetase [Amycolatopsis sp. Poz14]
MTDSATPKEVMAAAIAHDLRDGQWVEVGANLPVPRAGALLAHLHHGPDMTVMIAMTKAYVRETPVIEEFEFITDVGAMRWAEAYYQHDQLLNNQRHRANGVFFCGGIQIDRYGNSNLIGIGSDHKQLKFRGPGAIGTCNATVQNGHWHLVTTSHNPRVLVDRVDFVSALGYGRGEPNLRAELGLPNDGPASIVTPLCVFDFDEETRSARLKSVHPGVTKDEVVEKTGFEILVPETVPTTEGPTPEELALLRTRIDANGALRA